MQFDDDSRELFNQRMMMNEYFYRRKRQSIWLLMITLISFPIIFSLLWLVPPYQGILTRQEQILAAQLEGMEKIPNLEKKLSNLQSQISLLSNESIDARLQKIESAIHAGSIKTDDIGTIVQIKSDVDTLKTYMFKDPKDLVELKELQKNYSKLSENQSMYATKDSLRSEIGTLQTILTVSLTFFGILFTVVFGSWWFVGRKAVQTPQPTRPVHRPVATPHDQTEDEENQ